MFVVVSSSRRCPCGGGFSCSAVGAPSGRQLNNTPLPLCSVPFSLLPLSFPSLLLSLSSFSLFPPSSAPHSLVLPSPSTSLRGRGLGSPPPFAPCLPRSPRGPGRGRLPSPLPSGWRPRLAAPLLGVPKRFWGAHPRARQSAGWGASSPRGMRRAGVGGCARALGPRGPRGLRAGGGRLP